MQLEILISIFLFISICHNSRISTNIDMKLKYSKNKTMTSKMYNDIYIYIYVIFPCSRTTIEIPQKPTVCIYYHLWISLIEFISKTFNHCILNIITGIYYDLAITLPGQSICRWCLHQAGFGN